MEITKMKLGDLKIAPYNPRVMPKETMERLERSIEKFGYIEPVIVNKRNNVVVGGNQRVCALRKKFHKAQMVEVVVVDLPESQEKALNLALNKISGDWSMSKLENILLDLHNMDDDSLSLTGFDDDELFKMNILDEPSNEERFDVEKAIREPKYDIKTGEIWKLGAHRLMCGDATNRLNIGNLLGNKKADMVFTDPPYGINYKSNSWDSKKREVQTKNTSKEIINDGSIETALDSIRLLKTISSDKCHYYVTCRWDCFSEFKNEIEKMSSIKSVIVWDKGGPGLGDLKCSYGDNEWIIFSINGRKPLNNRENSVWEINRMKGLGMEHPTQKPVELPSRAIRNSSSKGDIVLDLFGGSGSTLIACEQSKRTCYMMEIDPLYCSVIIERWEELTGKKADNVAENKEKT